MIQNFQSALRKHRSVSIPERWTKVANDMDGRTAKECEHAYKEIAKSIKTGEPLSIAKNVNLINSKRDGTVDK